jgi:hypothetical protein
MSFSGLRDIFAGRVGSDSCVRSVLSLISPNNVKEYLIGVHKVAFPDGDTMKNGVLILARLVRLLSRKEIYQIRNS